MICEIVNYLPWCEINEACFVCKLWQKIGHYQQKFTTKLSCKYSSNNLTAEIEQGMTLLNNKHHDKKQLKIGKLHYMTRISDKIFEKLVKTFTRTGVLSPQSPEMTLADKIYKNSQLESLFRKKFMHGTMHGLTHKFVENLPKNVKNIQEKLTNKPVFDDEFYDSDGNCDVNNPHDDPFERSYKASTPGRMDYPNAENLQLAIPFNFERFKCIQFK